MKINLSFLQSDTTDGEYVMLYIIRHGKTEWNAKRKLQGRTDIPLNEDGRAMAENAAKQCAHINFDVCYCSPLIRAKETAEIILKGRNIPIIFDDRLVEMGFGKYEGIENVPLGCPISVMFERPQDYIPDGGAESFEELYARTGDFLKQVIAPLSESGKDVLIVGHGAMNSSIICRIRNIPLEKFWSVLTDNCELVRLI